MAKLGKMQTSINEELSVNISLSDDAMKLAYANYGDYINGDNARFLMDHWSQIISERGQRLRLAVQKASFHGLTSHRAIGRAIFSYEDFPWHKIAAILAGEWSAYHEAVSTIAGNPYYGFNKDLGKVSSANYRTLTWVAWEVLTCGSPGDAISGYKGVTRTPQEETRLERIISNYFRARNAYLSSDEPEDTAAMEIDKQKVVDLKTLMSQCGKLFQ